MATSPAISSTAAATASLQLDPPSFTVDEDDPAVEVWTFRLPVSVPLSALKGVKLNIHDGASTTFTADGKKYVIQMGDANETESFRVLVPNNAKSQDDDDDDSNSSSDDEDNENEEKGKKSTKKKGSLRPSTKAFSKHFQVLASVPTLTESQLAPREGPPPAETLRHAYAPVPQRSGLKRRWMPLGVAKPNDNEKSAASKKRSLSLDKPKAQASNKEEPSSESISVKAEPQSAPNKRKKREEDSDDSDTSSPEDKKLSKSERKAKRAEKKAAKKAKKEAKKAKKAAKKAKTSRS